MNNEHQEEFTVSGKKVLSKIKEIIKEGNAREIVIRTDEGKDIITLPLTVGALGALIIPSLAVVGAATALLTKCTIIVSKKRNEKVTQIESS